jgi:hypothetical protein
LSFNGEKPNLAKMFFMNKYFKDRRFVIKGQIREIGETKDGKTFVVLGRPNAHISGLFFYFFDAKNIEDVLTYKVHQYVTLNALFVKYNMFTKYFEFIDIKMLPENDNEKPSVDITDLIFVGYDHDEARFLQKKPIDDRESVSNELITLTPGQKIGSGYFCLVDTRNDRAVFEIYNDNYFAEYSLYLERKRY